MTSSSVWIVRRKRRCSVRERRISATGPPSGTSPCVAGGQRQRQRDVLLAAERDVAAPFGAQQLAERRTIFARERGRENLAVHAEGDLAARDLLQLGGQRIVEQEADAERAENVRLRADENRHRDELHHPVRLRQQAEALTAGERLADRRLVRDDERAARAEMPTVASTLPVLLVTSSRFVVELILPGDVFDRRLDRRRIVLGHRRLQLRACRR